MNTIAQRDALGLLTQPRLVEIATTLGIGVPDRLTRADLIDAIAASPIASFSTLLGLLSRNELKAICRDSGIDPTGRHKTLIADRILGRLRDIGSGTLIKEGFILAVAAATGFSKQDAEDTVFTVICAIVQPIHSGKSTAIA